MARTRGWEAFGRRLVRIAGRLAQQLVCEAMADRDRRGERSIQIAIVDPLPGSVRPHPVPGLTTAMTHVDVTCQPSGLQLVATMSQGVRDVYRVLMPGDQVVVAVPRGDLHAPSVIIAVLPSGLSPQPVPTAPLNTVVENLVGQVEMRAPSGVLLNGPGPGVARVGDAATLSAELVSWLSGVAVAAGYAPPMPSATATITTGSATVQAGG